MAVGIIRIVLADLPEMEKVLDAALELLEEVEEADEVLVTDAILDRGRELREAFTAAGLPAE